VKLK
jgi:hypothetical protein